MNGCKVALLSMFCAGFVSQAVAQGDYYYVHEGPVAISLTKTTQLPEVEVVKDSANSTTTTWTWKTLTTKITNKEIIQWVGTAKGITFSSGAKLMVEDDEDVFILFIRDRVLGDVSIDEYVDVELLGAPSSGYEKQTETFSPVVAYGSYLETGKAEFAVVFAEGFVNLPELLLTGYGTYSISEIWKETEDSASESGSASGRATITASYDDELPFVITGTISISVRAVKKVEMP